MLVYRTAQSSKAHRTESASVMGHKLTMRVSSRGSDQEQQNIFNCISLFWKVNTDGLEVPDFRCCNVANSFV